MRHRALFLLLVSLLMGPSVSTLRAVSPFNPLAAAPVYIEALPNHLNEFFAAQVIQQRLPIVLVADRDASLYTFVGAANTVTSAGASQTEFTLSLIDRQTGFVVWSGSARAKTEAGLRKPARALARQLGHDLFERTSPLRRLGEQLAGVFDTDRN